MLEKSVSMMETFSEPKDQKPTSKRLSMIESESRASRGGRMHKSSSLSRSRPAPASSMDPAYFR